MGCVRGTINVDGVDRAPNQCAGGANFQGVVIYALQGGIRIQSGTSAVIKTSSAEFFDCAILNIQPTGGRTSGSVVLDCHSGGHDLRANVSFEGCLNNALLADQL